MKKPLLSKLFIKMDSIRLLKIIKVGLILVFLFFITASFFGWLVEDSKEIKEREQKIKKRRRKRYRKN